MTLLSDRAVAGARYLAAFIELRAAFVGLSVLDRLTGSATFGPSPEMVPFRHPDYAPNLSGALHDGISEALAAAHTA